MLKQKVIVVLCLTLILSGCSSMERTWHSLVGGQNPLVGKIWNVRAQRFVSQTELVQDLVDVDYILLGEKHDNRDHHELQADVVRALVKQGKKPKVAFEQISADKAEKLAAYLSLQPKDASGIGDALGWKQAGWPDFKIYQPVFQAALDGGLQIIAANLSAQEERAVGAQGLEALNDDLYRSLNLDRGFSEGVMALMSEEIRASHCYMLPDSAVAKFTTIQRARDATIAARTEAAAKQDGAVFILGAGHARNEWGVPVYLKRINRITKVASLAFLEVKPEFTKPEIYVEGEAPYDYIWFTPSTETGDACEKHKAQLETMRKKFEGDSTGSENPKPVKTPTPLGKKRKKDKK